MDITAEGKTGQVTMIIRTSGLLPVRLKQSDAVSDAMKL
jgi:hypothetical protein